MLHQVVGVESSVSFQTGESFNIYSLLSHAEVSPDISSVLRFSVEDAHSYHRDEGFLLELHDVFPQTRATLGVSCWWEESIDDLTYWQYTSDGHNESSFPVQY